MEQDAYGNGNRDEGKRKVTRVSVILYDKGLAASIHHMTKDFVYDPGKSIASFIHVHSNGAEELITTNLPFKVTAYLD